MAQTETLSIRLNRETKRVLVDVAAERGSAGASALAREILDAWALRESKRLQQESRARLVSYLRENNGDWGDDPDEFFQPRPADNA